MRTSIEQIDLMNPKIFTLLIFETDESDTLRRLAVDMKQGAMTSQAVGRLCCGAEDCSLRVTYGDTPDGTLKQIETDCPDDGICTPKQNHEGILSAHNTTVMVMNSVGIVDQPICDWSNLQVRNEIEDITLGNG